MQNSQSPFLFEAESPMVFGQMLSAMARTTPVYYDEHRKSWVLLRQKDILAALRNPEVFSNAIFKRGPTASTFSAMDGEEHARQRRMYSKAFTPRAVLRYEQDIVEPAVHRLLDRIGRKGTRGQADLVTEFCIPLPIDVIALMMGLAPEYVRPCKVWVDAMIAWTLSLEDPEKIAVGKRAYRELTDHLRPEFEKQFVNPGQNLMGEFVRAQREEGCVKPEELMDIGAGLLAAGFETTIWMLACALGSLLLHPEALSRVQADRSLLMPAIEESMRWANSSVGTIRLTTREVEVSGVTLPAGATVLLCTAAAHYDEEVYKNPEVFDIDRRPNHLLFVTGPHHCLGAAVARMEARVGLSLLLDRMPGLRLSPRARPVYALNVADSAMHGPTELPVFFDEDCLARAA